MGDLKKTALISQINSIKMSHADSDLVFLYLIGHQDEDLFKYGITQDPEKRLKQLKAVEYLEDDGFPIKQAKICYLSDPLERVTARAIEILWPQQYSRPFISWRTHKYLEVIRGDISELSRSLKEYVNFFEWDNYLNTPSVAWHFFGWRETTKVYERASSSHAIELASISECNPFFSHHSSFIGNGRKMGILRDMYRGHKGLPKQTYTIFNESVSILVDRISKIDINMFDLKLNADKVLPKIWKFDENKHMEEYTDI